MKSDANAAADMSQSPSPRSVTGSSEPAGLAALRREAAGAHGLVRSSRLPAAGLTRFICRRLFADGWLVEVRKGVILVGGGTPSEWQRAVATWMAAGSGAAMSHATAARVHRLACWPVLSGAPVEVSVPRPRHPRLSDCRLHRVGDLTPDSVTSRRGVVVTTPARTLVDVAPRLTAGVIRRTVEEGYLTGAWTREELAGAVESARRRPHLGPLREAVGSASMAIGVASHLEQRVARILAFLGPFETQFQVVAGGKVFVLDIAWPERRVAVEIDGLAVHGTRGRFDSDRRRGNELAAAGWTVVHVTAAMSDDEIRASVCRVLLRTAPAGARG